MSNVNQQQLQQQGIVDPILFSQTQIIGIQKSIFLLNQIIEELAKQNLQMKNELSKQPNIVDSKFKEFNSNVPVNKLG